VSRPEHVVKGEALMEARDAARAAWRTCVNEGRSDDVCRHWSGMAGWLKGRADEIAAEREADWPDAMYADLAITDWEDDA
jgi:hypothetical protein